jgi:large subunit ribosomal protein L14
MIQQESNVIVADNTGAKTAQVIRVLKGSTGKIAGVGDIVVVAIKSATPSGQVAKASVQRGVVVRTRKEIRRADGTYVRFDDNAIALIGKNKEPLGKRVFWPVAKELREKGFRTVAVMAEEII